MTDQEPPENDRPRQPQATGQAETQEAPRKKTVALVLGSGGARGYAHIGAIEVLEERGYQVVATSGCSMGALIGGLHAAGCMQDYKDWVTGLGQFDVLRLLDVSWSTPGAIRGDKVFSVVRDMIGETQIEDLPVSYTAVATDLLSHKEIWFQEGPLHQAIRASIAIPGVITPVVFNGRVLVDGALLNPLPIIPTIASHADYIFAVNLAGEDQHRPSMPEALRQDDEDSDLDEWLDKVRSKASRWFDWDVLRSLGGRTQTTAEEAADAQARKRRRKTTGESEDGPVDPSADDPARIDWDKLDIGKFDIMNLSIETMQSALIQYKIAGYPPDMVVNLPKSACRTYDYHKAPELIQLGRQKMTQALDRFEENGSSSGLLSP